MSSENPPSDPMSSTTSNPAPPTSSQANETTNTTDNSVSATSEDAVSEVVSIVGDVAPSIVGGFFSDMASHLGDLIDGTDGNAPVPKEVVYNTFFIVLGAFSAQLIFFSVATNLTLFTKEFLDYGYSEAQTTEIIVFAINILLFPIIGLISDSCTGPYSVMHVGGVFCLLGTCVFPLISFDWAQYGPQYGLPIYQRQIYYFIGRLLIGLGVVAINTTAPPFAASQVERYGDAVLQTFFHILYSALQFAPLIAYTSLTFVQTRVSFFVGFVIVVIVNLGIMGFFVYAKDYYKTTHQAVCSTTPAVTVAKVAHKTVTGSLKSTCGNLCSWIRDKISCTSCPSCLSSTVVDDMEVVVDETIPLIGVLDPGPTTASNDGGGITADTSQPGPALLAAPPPTTPPETPPKYYGRINVQNFASVSGISEDMVVSSLKILYASLLLSALLPYGIVRYQTSSSFLEQAQHLRPQIFGRAISPDIVTSILPAVGVALAPIVNVYVYPYLSEHLVSTTVSFRTFWGLVCATLSVLFAAAVESARLNIIADGGSSVITSGDGIEYVVSDLSLVYIIPQYLLMALADVFIYIAGLEFAFKQSLQLLPATLTGIFFFYFTLGHLVGILLVPAINALTEGDEWYPPDINNGHLAYYFLVLAAINTVNTVVVYVLFKGFDYVNGQVDESADDGGTTANNTATQPQQPQRTVTS
ncbi:solute carrier family 15 member 4-like [Diadema antillarum]|uniref:solute carrier family 15 member 4-like n=1 Tax=Diadema antillarum TaxID=105358 RepID=UPI003A8928D7